MGLFSAIAGSAISGFLGSKSSKKAAKQQAQANQQAIDFQREQAKIARRDLKPWRESGTKSNNFLTRLLGLSGEEVDVTAEMEANSPGYRFRKSEGDKAVTNSLAARSNILSGRAIKDALRFSQDFASNEFGNYFNRLFSVSEQGRGAAGASANIAAGLGTQVGNALQNIGTANANGTIGSANAITGGISSGINNYLALQAQQDLLRTIREAGR